MKTKNQSLLKENPKPGTWFTATINGTDVVGKVQKEDGAFYLCQNKEDGTECSNTLGFKYSWRVDKGTLEALEYNDVCNLVILKEKPDYFKFEPIFKIGLYAVTFNKGYIMVGCTKVTNAMIKKVALKQGLL